MPIQINFALGLLVVESCPWEVSRQVGLKPETDSARPSYKVPVASVSGLGRPASLDVPFGGCGRGAMEAEVPVSICHVYVVIISISSIRVYIYIYIHIYT